MKEGTLYCTVPYFGFKAKLEPIEAGAAIDCTVPYFGFKAKLRGGVLVECSNCTVPYFGFKAKLLAIESKLSNIVLCLILDSRQNGHHKCSYYYLLYCALFWIQGKT